MIYIIAAFVIGVLFGNLIEAIKDLRELEKLGEEIKNLEKSFDERVGTIKDSNIKLLTDFIAEVEECVDGGEGNFSFECGVGCARTQVVEMLRDKIEEIKGESENRVD